MPKLVQTLTRIHTHMYKVHKFKEMDYVADPLQRKNTFSEWLRIQRCTFMSVLTWLNERKCKLNKQLFQQETPISRKKFMFTTQKARGYSLHSKISLKIAISRLHLTPIHLGTFSRSANHRSAWRSQPGGHPAPGQYSQCHMQLCWQSQ